MGTSTLFEISVSALAFMVGYVWAVISQRYVYESLLSFSYGVLAMLIGTVFTGTIVFLFGDLSVIFMMGMFTFFLTYFLTWLLLSIFYPRKKVVSEEVVSEGV